MCCLPTNRYPVKMLVSLVATAILFGVAVDGKTYDKKPHNNGGHHEQSSLMDRQGYKMGTPTRQTTSTATTRASFPAGNLWGGSSFGAGYGSGSQSGGKSQYGNAPSQSSGSQSGKGQSGSGSSYGSSQHPSGGSQYGINQPEGGSQNGYNQKPGTSQYGNNQQPGSSQYGKGQQHGSSRYGYTQQPGGLQHGNKEQHGGGPQYGSGRKPGAGPQHGDREFGGPHQFGSGSGSGDGHGGWGNSQFGGGQQGNAGSQFGGQQNYAGGGGQQANAGSQFGGQQNYAGSQSGGQRPGQSSAMPGLQTSAPFVYLNKDPNRPPGTSPATFEQTRFTTTSAPNRYPGIPTGQPFFGPSWYGGSGPVSNMGSQNNAGPNQGGQGHPLYDSKESMFATNANTGGWGKANSGDSKGATNKANPYQSTPGYGVSGAKQIVQKRQAYDMGGNEGYDPYGLQDDDFNFGGTVPDANTFSYAPAAFDEWEQYQPSVINLGPRWL